MEEELTDAQVEELRAELMGLEAKLRAQLDVAREDARPVSLDSPIGRLSRMDAMQQQQMLKANQQRIQARISQIGGAMRRLDEDAYGWCVLCDEPIGFRRLKARPEAPLCLACQSKTERR